MVKLNHNDAPDLACCPRCHYIEKRYNFPTVLYHETDSAWKDNY